MIKLIARRFLGMIPMLFFISIVVFGLGKAMPGDAFSGEIDPQNTSPEYIEEMRQKTGYYDPVHVQYYNWISKFVQGDFGKSSRHKIDVSTLIAQKIPNTILLAVVSLIITYVLAFFMGMYAGRKPYSLGDNLIAGFNYTGLAIPSFVAGVFAIYFFSFKLNLIPFAGSVDIEATKGTLEYYLSRLHHVIMPAIVLGIFSTASYTQFLRNDLIENSRKDYVRTARAKGTPMSRVYNVHILRNSIIPLVTFLGFDIAALLGGAIITEKIFTYPGIGLLFLDSVVSNDFPTMMAITMMLSFLVLVGNLLADILYGVVDPRIRLS
ncbi:oligopeptide ABC transporter permease [Sporosarcina sp. CAU 1771]